jgi:isoquinoline 1-oxidoreductase alpha subunit
METGVANSARQRGQGPQVLRAARENAILRPADHRRVARQRHDRDAPNLNAGPFARAAFDERRPCRQYNRRMQQTPQAPPTQITPQPVRSGVDVTINGKHFRHTGDPELPLLWYLRDVLRLTGCKYGCDDASCGACSVLVDGKLKRACMLAMQDLVGKDITTVEGLVGADGTLHPVQQAWIDEDAILCGYCQPGQLMAAVDLLARKPNPSDKDIDGIGNLCRCGSYPRIRRAIQRASKAMQGKSR